MARLVQFTDEEGARNVGLVAGEGGSLRVLDEVESVYELALGAARSGRRLADLADRTIFRIFLNL